MTCGLSIALGQIKVLDEFGEDVEDERVVEAISDPGEEGVHLEECVLLTDLVELGVAVEEAVGDELIEDTHCERGKDGEEDVVEGEGPGFVDNFSREGVAERELGMLVGFH